MDWAGHLVLVLCRSLTQVDSQLKGHALGLKEDESSGYLPLILESVQQSPSLLRNKFPHLRVSACG